MTHLIFSDTYFNRYRAVVATEDVRVYLGGNQLGLETVGTEPVVYAPTHILFPGMEAVGPPGINIGLQGMEVAEGVGKAGCQEFCELLAFLIGKARIVVVGLGILDVYFLMGHVHVATNKNGLHTV